MILKGQLFGTAKNDSNHDTEIANRSSSGIVKSSMNSKKNYIMLASKFPGEICDWLMKTFMDYFMRLMLQFQKKEFDDLTCAHARF